MTKEQDAMGGKEGKDQTVEDETGSGSSSSGSSSLGETGGMNGGKLE